MAPKKGQAKELNGPVHWDDSADSADDDWKPADSEVERHSLYAQFRTVADNGFQGPVSYRSSSRCSTCGACSTCPTCSTVSTDFNDTSASSSFSAISLASDYYFDYDHAPSPPPPSPSGLSEHDDSFEDTMATSRFFYADQMPPAPPSSPVGQLYGAENAAAAPKSGHVRFRHKPWTGRFVPVLINRKRPQTVDRVVQTDDWDVQLTMTVTADGNGRPTVNFDDQVVANAAADQRDKVAAKKSVVIVVKDGGRRCDTAAGPPEQFEIDDEYDEDEYPQNRAEKCLYWSLKKCGCTIQ